MKRLSSLLIIAVIVALAFKLGHRGSNSVAKVAIETELPQLQEQPQAPMQNDKLEAVAVPNFHEPKTDEAQLNEILYERDLTELFSAIPKLKKENLTGEETHGFSPMELQEAQALAEIQNVVSKNKQFPAVTQKLYKDCSSDDGLAATVRAVCYFHALELSVPLNNSSDITQIELPIEIKKLAMKLKPSGYL